jgi:flagellar protein FliO/FliZ
MKALYLLHIPLLVLFPALAVAAEGKPLDHGLDPLGGGLTQLILGLVLILALIAGAAWLLRRFLPLRGGDGAIKILGGLALGARERLVLVQVEEARLLLGIAPGRVQTLHVLAGPAAKQSFAKTLATAEEGVRHA